MFLFSIHLGWVERHYLLGTALFFSLIGPGGFSPGISRDFFPVKPCTKKADAADTEKARKALPEGGIPCHGKRVGAKRFPTFPNHMIVI